MLAGSCNCLLSCAVELLFNRAVFSSEPVALGTFLLAQTTAAMCVPGICLPGLQQPPVARLKHTYLHLVHAFRCVLSRMASSLQTLCLVDVGQRSFLRVTNMLDLIPRLLASMDLKYSNVSRSMAISAMQWHVPQQFCRFTTP